MQGLSLAGGIFLLMKTLYGAVQKIRGAICVTLQTGDFGFMKQRTRKPLEIFGRDLFGKCPKRGYGTGCDPLISPLRNDPGGTLKILRIQKERKGHLPLPVLKKHLGDAISLL